MDVDAETLLRSGQGCPQATATLYRRHSAACLLLAHRTLRDRGKAEDAVQEAFLDAWRHAGRFDPRRASVRSWLLMLTHRKAVDRVRHDALRATVSLELTDDPHDPARGPEQSAFATLLAAPVQQAMASLPAVQREALMLAYWGGFTQREIAVMTRCPLGTVKTRMRNGMRTLARGLGELEEEAAHGSARLPVVRDLPD